VIGKKCFRGSKLPKASEHFQKVRTLLTDADIATRLHESIERSFKADGFTADRFVKYVPTVLEHFDNQVPDCGEGADPVIHATAVFNAVWERSFRNLSESVGGAALFSEREILCNLALKSVEANYIQHLWNEK
jgi:hypothetical protein